MGKCTNKNEEKSYNNILTISCEVHIWAIFSTKNIWDWTGLWSSSRVRKMEHSKIRKNGTRVYESVKHVLL